MYVYPVTFLVVYFINIHVIMCTSRVNRAVNPKSLRLCVKLLPRENVGLGIIGLIKGIGPMMEITAKNEIEVIICDNITEVIYMYTTSVIS